MAATSAQPLESSRSLIRWHGLTAIILPVLVSFWSHTIPTPVIRIIQIVYKSKYKLTVEQRPFAPIWNDFVTSTDMLGLYSLIP